MTALLVLAVAVAGGFGAALRFLVDGLVRGATGTRFPVGTMLINLSGSLVLGFVTGLATAHLLDPAWASALGTGVMGGYTTFSTASFETVRLLQQRRLAAGLVNGLGMLVAAVLLGGLGLLAGSAL